MIENTDLMIENLYRKAYEKVLQVYEVFKDYFGEELVDITGIPSLGVFKNQLASRKYNSYISKTYIQESLIFNEYDDVTKETINTLIGASALSTCITSDITVFKYFYPFLYEYYTRQPINMSESNILVRFPEVRISNENEKFVDIKELYARVKINMDGKILGTFGLLRADYPISHLIADYAHSHISGVTLNANYFASPCLGSGPIRNTIMSLARDCDLNIWMLFCRELDTYVTVESISGGPYRRLESITGKKKLIQIAMNFTSTLYIENFDGIYNSDIFAISTFKKFIKYLLEKKVIKFNYSEGCYNLAMSYKDFMISISNCFIDFINNKMERSTANLRQFSLDNMLNRGLLKEFVIKDNNLYQISNSEHTISSYLQYNGKEVLRFKNSPVCLNVYDDIENEENNTVRLLNFKLSEYILFHMINYLNIAYGKQTNTEIRSTQKFIVV